ncbi:hypothetical protein HPP92_023328 [Vanilla planifolia]|uniref:Uncharacterized protein n=1 Tax=Vanilla planifolia TaxID=51239 RepID=A0A835PX33_VANPL|nr:hypothetical protein HPP92_023589 [Vanilla planifolia]KAG0460200.1 hypothetical protein HPP92_023328 [Vanilla planifolia]
MEDGVVVWVDGVVQVKKEVTTSAEDKGTRTFVQSLDVNGGKKHGNFFPNLSGGKISLIVREVELSQVACFKRLESAEGSEIRSLRVPTHRTNHQKTSVPPSSTTSENPSASRPSMTMLWATPNTHRKNDGEELVTEH